VRMNVRITDEATGEVTHFSVDFIRDNTYLASLVFSSGLTLLDRTLNQVGKGTLDAEYTIRGAGLPRRLEREDIFTSFNDIAVPGPLQVAQIVLLLAQNEFQDPQLDTIDMDLTYIPEVRSARLVGITADKQVYRPGEVVQYEAEFKPYRGEPFTVGGNIRIPQGLKATRLTLHAYGGQLPSTTSDTGNAPAFENLEQIIEVVEGLSRNDQLTAQFLGIPESDLDVGDAIKNSDQIGGWVISGEHRLTLEIDHATEQAPTVTEPQEQPETQQEAETETEEQPGGETESDDAEDSDSPQQECKQLFYC